MQQNAMRIVPHPLDSPDLALSDFYLFGYIKQLLSGCEFTDGIHFFKWPGTFWMVLKKLLSKASFATGCRDCTNVVQWVKSMWSKEIFCLNRISRNSPDPEMLMGGWDTL
jgi:hypothetical protein